MRSPAPGSPASSRIPVSIVVGRFDDLLARGLRDLLDGDPSLDVVAEGIEQRRVSVVLRAHRPDVALLDVGALEKLADVRELSLLHPSTRLVLLAEELSSVECAQLLAFGASACLGRDTQARDVLNAVHLASRGLQLVPRSASSAGEAVAGGQLLTCREAEVLPLLQLGRTNAQIALALDVGVETVRTHARNIYRKLGVASRRELVAPRVRERGDPATSRSPSPRRRAAARGSRPRRGHDEHHR
jgi:DNA-binding NarL/FixJ family response regulator